jgi:archaemetzincin
MFAAIALLAYAKGYLVFWPRPVSLRTTTIELVPMGDLDPAFLQAVADGAAEVYAVPCYVASDAWPTLADAYDATRGKYEAGLLLKDLVRRRTARGVRQIGMIADDITVGEMNFVFGYAQMPGTTAVMSLTRLHPRKDSDEAEKLFRDRATSIVIHELGHTFGFSHCRDERCVMAYTETAAGVDLSGREFCDSCASRLRR